MVDLIQVFNLLCDNPKKNECSFSSELYFNVRSIPDTLTGGGSAISCPYDVLHQN